MPQYIDMQWEFRKTIESFQGYKRTVAFKNEIENGDENTLDTVVRQVEMILGDKNEKILIKVLAIRFIRDIMVLGQEEVVKRVEKLIPQLTKICSHDLQNTGPDRGETFFHDHPAYTKAKSEDEKKEIDTYGSTYLILALQSIYHWAKWIPIDSNGHQSIYSKAYQTLMDRKVVFPTSFHYYKQSDTEKFKNTYKMEFFTDSYESAYSETSSVQPSQISEAQEKESRSGWEKKSKMIESRPVQGSIVASEQYTGEAHNLRTVNDMMQYLNELRDSKSRKTGALKQILKNIQNMYEIQGGMGRLPKNQKKWLQNYIINYSLLNSNIIDYHQFLQRSLSEEIVIEEGVQEQEITMTRDHKLSPMKPQLPNTKSFKQLSKVNKNEFGVEREGSQVIKKQEYQYKTKLNSLVVELEEKNNEIAIIRSNHEKEKQKIIEDYECRIGIIKTEVKKGQQDKGTFQRELEKENERLRVKVATLEEEIGNTNYNNDRERDLQSERNHLLTRVKRLEIENQKLQQIKSVSRNYDKQISNFQALIKEKEGALQMLKGELKKSEKININYQDQANLYKTQLINERAKHEQKINTLVKSKSSLENQNNSLKEKNLEYRKVLDVKEIELINIREELKRYQSKVKDLNEKKSYVGVQNPKSQQWMKSRTALQYQSPVKLQGATSPEKEMYSAQMFGSDNKLRFSNYEDLYEELKPNNKELFIRLCRCGLKRKDILLKENELEIGIITEVISESKLKFMLHFTNTSEKQVQNLKIEYNMANSYPSTLEYTVDNKYIFCIQPQEQEKVCVTVANRQAPYIKERAILEVSFEKNGVLYESNVFLPFFITKFFDFYKPKGIKMQQRTKFQKQVSQFRYNKKMLPKANSLKGFFQSIEQIIPNKFELEAFHRETDLSVKLGFTLTPDSEGMQMEAQVMREKMNEKQKFVFEELFGFLEVALRR